MWKEKKKCDVNGSEISIRIVSVSSGVMTQKQFQYRNYHAKLSWEVLDSTIVFALQTFMSWKVYVLFLHHFCPHTKMSLGLQGFLVPQNIPTLLILI